MKRQAIFARLGQYSSGVAGLVLLGAMVLVALLAPFAAPSDPLALDLASKLLPPSSDHLLGTDQAGRDLLSRIIWEHGNPYSLHLVPFFSERFSGSALV